MRDNNLWNMINDGYKLIKLVLPNLATNEKLLWWIKLKLINRYSQNNVCRNIYIDLRNY